MKPRPYQEDLSDTAVNILTRKRIVYLAMEVRTGKTLTALLTAEKYKAKKVLFLTKKKAISSILFDYENYDHGFNFSLKVTNDESLHLVNEKFDLIIHDEHHRFGTYPKPNKSAKLFKEKFSHLPMIFLSGTMSPESYSQLYHQFWVSDHSPFREYQNFYKWAEKFVNIKKKHLGYATVNDYSDANYKLFSGIIKHLIVKFTQEQAGFTTSVNEMVLECEMKPITGQIIQRLKRDLVVINSKGNVILGDTAAKLMQKIHQLSSGTCKFEDGTSKVIDYSKVEYIYEKFKDEKIAIFYNFSEEYNCMKDFLGDKLTNDLDEFKTNPDKWIALQIVSGREGISLSVAKYLVFFNISHSALSYWQSRDRLTTMERKDNQIFYIFSKNGIEHKIYKNVQGKKDYTLTHFRQDLKML